MEMLAGATEPDQDLVTRILVTVPEVSRGLGCPCCCCWLLIGTIIKVEIKREQALAA